MRVPRLNRTQRRELRVMQRRLRELDRADARARASGIDPYQAWLDVRAGDARRGSPGSATRRRPTRRLRTLVIIVMACALPIGGTVAVRTLSASDDGRAGFPPAGQEILASAFRRLHDLTGFKLVNDGPTNEPPGENRAPYQPDRYGDRWAPILVAWTTPTEIPGLSGMTIGLGGSVAVSDRSGRRTYVSGVLFLDRPQIESQLADTAVGGSTVSRRAQIRAVMLHEIGHIVGLDHVGDPSQLMYPIAGPTLTDFSAGDLRGLYRLATGPCAPGI